MSSTPHSRDPQDSRHPRDFSEADNGRRQSDDTRVDSYSRNRGGDSRVTDDDSRAAYGDHGAQDATGGPLRGGLADRRTVVAAEEAEYGGVKPGAAFFGWLSATGMAVILTGILAAAGTALGLAKGTDLGEAASDATNNPEGVGIAGIIGLGVILLIAYYCGGYVAGRMARFQGARQGVAVWVWALLIAGVVALLGIIAGNEYNVLEQIDAFPRIPVDEGTLSTAGIIALAVALLTSLVGAILGGIAGVRYHRKVDRAGLVD